MPKTIGHRLFRLGCVPHRWRDRLEAEGIRILEEGIRCTVTWGNYRAPGRYHAWRRSWGSGAVALTQKRLFVSYYRWPMLNVETDRFARIEISSPASDALVLSFDVADLYADRRGRITIRLRVAEAARLFQVLSASCSIHA
jgi:hypothetical protein